MVAVVQSADVRNSDHVGGVGRFNSPAHGRILAQRQMRPQVMVVGDVRSKDAPRGPLVEHDHVIEALSSGASAINCCYHALISF